MLTLWLSLSISLRTLFFFIIASCIWLSATSKLTIFSNKNYLNVEPSCFPGEDDAKLAKARKPVLSQFRWLRLVVDEAHELEVETKYSRNKACIGNVTHIQATFR